MIASGQALEDYAQEHAKKELTDLLKRAPKIAHKKVGTDFVDVPVDSVNVGDILQIKPGEVVPVDSVITKGRTSIDESALTGESMPLDKKEGGILLSGSINQQSVILVRAQHVSKDSQYEQIVALVSNAASAKSPFVRMADAYSVPFTIISLTIAGVAWATSGQPVRALEVLVLATPCPLLIATPVALVSGMSKGARRGIIFKHGAALEKLARVKAIAFDKTGTLTVGVPRVDSIAPHNESFTTERVLSLAAAAESSSTHTLALATVSEAKEQRLTIPKVSKLTETVGSGVVALVENKLVIVGKAAFLQAQGITAQLDSHDKTAIFIAYDGTYIGAIYFSDTLRPDAKQTLIKLKKLGVKRFMMLTGDKQAVADRIAKNVGITHVTADCLPADKLHALKKFKRTYQPIAFVGDGVNDAPSLASADIGIALGAKGSTVASETADVVIMLDSFSKIAEAVTISRRTISIAKQSIFLGIGLSIVLMLFAGITGYLKPVYGAFVQELVDIIAIFLALRARK
jgi:heavy metal translocating P-type ATPase